MRNPYDPGVTRMALQLCAQCGYAFDAFASHDGSDTTPEPGMFAVCLNCAGLSVFGADGALHTADAAANADFNTDPDFVGVRAQRALLLARIDAGRPNTRQAAREARRNPH